MGQVTQALPANLSAGTSAPFTMTYTNGDKGQATGVSVALPTATGLTITDNTCGTTSRPITLAANTSCAINGTYSPPIDTTGLQRFTTNLSYHQGTNVPLTTSTTVDTIAVSGEVTQALPANMSESQSAPFTMTYTNGDKGTATSVSVALPTAPGLVIDSNTCGTASRPISLPANGNCTINGTYTASISALGLQRFTTTLSYDQGAPVPLTISTTVGL